MDAGTGDIYHIDINTDTADKQREAFEALAMKETEYGRPQIPLNEQQYDKLNPLNKKQRLGTMRNQPCVCGSGIKFKRCCWNLYT